MHVLDIGQSASDHIVSKIDPKAGTINEVFPVRHSTLNTEVTDSLI